MKKILRKYYDLPKVDNHFVAKTVSELKDGDLILDFMDYRSHVTCDSIEKSSSQKNLYKVLTFETAKATLLADDKTMAIVFNKPVGILSFNFFYNCVVRIKTFFGLINYDTFSPCAATTRYVSYFMPNAYPFKEGKSLIKNLELTEEVLCLINPEALVNKLSQSSETRNDRHEFWVMNYSDYFIPAV